MGAQEKERDPSIGEASLNGLTPPNKSDWLEIAGLVIIAILFLLLVLFAPHSVVDRVIHAAPPLEAAPLQTSARESIGERETRAALGRIFGKPFIKVRPPWLINPETKRRLELDCFNAEESLGVEFNGYQHHVFPNVFHRARADFDAQVRRDRYKAEQCHQRGVRLIVVPHTIPVAQIETFLRAQLKVDDDEKKNHVTSAPIQHVV